MIYSFPFGVRRLVPRDEVGRVADQRPIGGPCSAARMLPRQGSNPRPSDSHTLGDIHRGRPVDSAVANHDQVAT